MIKSVSDDNPIPKAKYKVIFYHPITYLRVWKKNTISRNGRQKIIFQNTPQ